MIGSAPLRTAVFGRRRVTIWPESLALYARMSTPPTDARKALINALINALITSGVWAKLDFLHVLAAADSQAARLNWVSANYNHTASNSPSFTADRGYTGDGSSSYLNSGFNPTTAVTPQYTLNSACLGIWGRTSASVTGGAIGTTATPSAGIWPRETGQSYYYINDGTSANTANADGSGLFVASRTASNARALYHNATAIMSTSTASVSIPNSNVVVLRQLIGYYAGQIAVDFAGSGLTAGEVATVYAALNVYLTAIGAA